MISIHQAGQVLISRHPASIPRQLVAIAVASLTAIAANVAYYFILKEFVGIEFIAPDEPGVEPRGIAPLPATDVVIFSIVYCVGACIVFLIVANTVRRPAPVFVTISLVVLLLSLFLPFFMPTPPISVTTEAGLASMHILGAAVLVPLLVAIGLPKISNDHDVGHQP